MMEVLPTWLSMKQASDYSNLSYSTLKRHIDSGSLKASKRVKKTLINRFTLDAWLLNK